MTIQSEKLAFIKECEADIKAVTSAREIKWQKGEFSVTIGNVIEE